MSDTIELMIIFFIVMSFCVNGKRKMQASGVLSESPHIPLFYYFFNIKDYYGMNMNNTNATTPTESP